MKPTIEDLLNALSNPNKIEGKPSLENTKETWSRISSKTDKFLELNLEESDLSDFLKEWIENNPYNNIS